MKSLSKIILIAFLSLLVSEMQAQHGGFKFGLAMANAKVKTLEGESPDVDNKILYAPKVGFIFDTPLYEGLFLQTGVLTTVSGFKFEDEREELVSKESFVLLYLEMPLDIGYRHQLNDNLHVMGMVGPVFRYLTYSTLAFKVDGEWDNEPTHTGEGDDKAEYFDNFDLNLNIEAGVQYNRYQFTLYYNPGFTNIFNKESSLDISEWKNSSFGINIGILFGQVD